MLTNIHHTKGQSAVSPPYPLSPCPIYNLSQQGHVTEANLVRGLARNPGSPNTLETAVRWKTNHLAVPSVVPVRVWLCRHMGKSLHTQTQSRIQRLASKVGEVTILQLARKRLPAKEVYAQRLLTGEHMPCDQSVREQRLPHLCRQRRRQLKRAVCSDFALIQYDSLVYTGSCKIGVIAVVTCRKRCGVCNVI